LKTVAEQIRHKHETKLKNNKARQKDIQSHLQSNQLNPSEKEKLLKQLKTIEKTIEITNKVNKDIFDRVAKMLLGNWKFSKSLYEKYGGTVIWQQTGTEAVEATRLWLEEHEKKGNFKIYDDTLRKMFWEYYVRQDHPFIVKRSEPFGVPPWLEDQQGKDKSAKK